MSYHLRSKLPPQAIASYPHYLTSTGRTFPLGASDEIAKGKDWERPLKPRESSAAYTYLYAPDSLTKTRHKHDGKSWTCSLRSKAQRGRASFRVGPAAAHADVGALEQALGQRNACSYRPDPLHFQKRRLFEPDTPDKATRLPHVSPRPNSLREEIRRGRSPLLPFREDLTYMTCMCGLQSCRMEMVQPRRGDR